MGNSAVNTIGNQISHSLFISDLHLCASRPHITQIFIDFLQARASQADALYILGDFFEYWAGDDDIAHTDHQSVIAALRTLNLQGTHVYFMHGNRDFLISEAFAETCGIILLADPTLLHLYGQNVLLSHGDALCTDDTDYQTFRAQVRSTEWQTHFLKQPLTERKQQIEALRKRSEREKSYKSESIMDVNADAVAQLLKTYDYPPLFVHGHTHRPAKHEINLDGHAIERWVLGDWYEQGSCLRLDETGCTALLIDNEK